MAGVAAAAIGGSAVLGFVGSQNASNAQSNAMGQSIALQREMFNYQKAQQAPYQEAGVKALGQMQDPRFQKSFSKDQFQTSPGYQFSLQQGQDALNAMNAATGNQVSGAGMAALSKYNVGSANQEYQQAFENYNNQLQQQYGRLGVLSAGGAGANNAMGAAANNMSMMGSNALAGMGNAQAAGQLGQMGAISQGLGGLAGVYGARQAAGFAQAPSGSGYSTMGQWGSAPESNLQMPSSGGYLGLE